MLVQIPPRDLSKCRQAATGRWQLARMSGVGNQRKDGSRSDNDIDYLGVRAEFAVAALLQLDYEPSALGIDDGADMWCGGVNIDVKSTFYPDGRMLFKSRDAFKSVVCVLVSSTEDDSVMNVRGWAAAADFSEHSVQVDLGHGPCWIMENEKLRPMPDLWSRLAKKRVGVDL
eukprot:GHVR01021644.1.p1 GENE.GHVR01021644.1~~GHVR01021644.1.p1  ORF type:complete len:172 (+),score=20.95 GHVR01021644.1:147-662(+)